MVWPVYAFVIGLLFGSFANVVIYRWPRGLSIIAPPSACTACGRRLLAFDLVPVASWLALKGRCRYCRAVISMRYPLVELCCAVLFAVTAFVFTSFSAVPLAFLCFILLCAAMIGIDTREIPNALLIAGAAAGLLWVGAGHFAPSVFPHAPVWHSALIGAAVGCAPSPLIKENAKLTAMLGIFLGWQLMLVAFFFTIALMGAAGAYLLAKKRIKRGTKWPLTPFLSLGGIMALWLGQSLLHILGIG